MRKAYNGLSYYVVAHQDDWQLFYGQQAFSDLEEPDSRVVFIYATAGDAGQTNGWWQAREKGALAAQALPLGLAPFKKEHAIKINNHNVAVYDSGSFASYHMRLPDGNVDGNGFETTSNVSLEKLQIGCIPQITAVDNSTTYDGWEDFCATIMAIIDREHSGSCVASPWVNAADWSWNCSPRDHSDHKATGNALRKVFCQRGNVFNRLWFVTYATGVRDANLFGEALERKQAIWLAYANTVQAVCGAEPVWWEWNNWGDKNYSRRVLAAENDMGAC